MASNKKISNQEKIEYWKGQLDEMNKKRERLIAVMREMRELGMNLNEANEMNRDMKDDINEVRFYIKMLALEG